MDLAAIDELLAELTAQDRFSGVVHFEGATGPVASNAYGLASRAWGVPCTMDTRFDCASMTKLFTAVVALQVIDEGGFALDTDVVSYLGLEGTALGPGITPYHLLTHTSGIADDADEEAGESYEDLFVATPNYAVRTTEDHLPFFVHKEPNFAPGAGCRYCNSGYMLLGLMVERARGVPFVDCVADRVFRPAGMTRSGFFSMDRVEPDVAEGVDPVTGPDGEIAGWRRNIYSYPPIGSPDGGAHVTAGDMVRFHRALVGGELLSAAATQAMLEPKVPYRPDELQGRMTGFCLQFEQHTDGRIRSSWKEGINVGASGILAHYPEPDITLVMLSNLEDGVWEPLREIDRQLAPPLD